MMRSTKSVRSLHSVSGASTTSSYDIMNEVNQLPSMLFEDLLPFICKKFGCEFEVFVKKDYVHDEFHRYMTSIPIKRKQKIFSTPFSSVRSTRKPEDEVVETVGSPGMIATQLGVITVTALYNNSDRLVEILLYRIPEVPRILMQAISVIAPNYERLTKITVQQCGINAYVLHDLNKVVLLMTLTDLCLDDCYQPQANFALFLEIATSLRNLSLARCRLSDEACQKIISQIHFASPAERNLLLLNLSGNGITDVGAKYIADMLRNNRRLRYLNLTSNLITDDGANCILDVLKEYPLTYDEITEKRGRLFDYLRKRKTIMDKYLHDADLWATTNDAGSSSSRKSSVKKRFSMKQVSVTEVGSLKSLKKETPDEHIRAKISMLTDQVMGQYCDPFSRNNLITKNDWPHCIGNLTLSYLNLAYNNITFFSVKKMAEVLVYQGTLTNMECGLIKINLDGNNIPIACEEYNTITNELNKKMLLFTRDTSRSSKRKSHAKISLAAPTVK